MKSHRKILSIAGFVLGLLSTLSNYGWTEPIRALAITDSGGGLGFEYFYKTESAQSATRNQEVEQTIFRETLAIWNKGYIYHPNLIDFDIGLDLNLNQNMREGNTRTSQLVGFDVRMQIEKKRPYGFELFAVREQTVSGEDFSADSIIDVTQYGIGWRLRDFAVPLSINYSSSISERTGNSDRTEEKQQVNVSSSHSFGGFSKTTADYNFKTFDTGSTASERDTHEFFLSNSLRWGEEHSRNLQSNFRYSIEEQNNQVDQASFSTNLSWIHAKNLNSSYGLSANHSSVSGPGSETIDTLTHNENAQLAHKLYENLNTLVLARMNGTESDSFNGQVYGGGISFGYERPIPIGQIRAGFGYSYDRSEQQSSGLASIVDESHVLTDGTFVYLDNLNVDSTSIFVTDTTGTIFYEEHTDYELVPVGNRLRIDRVTIGGNISNGQEILVDYFFTSEGDFAYESTGINANLGFSFSPIPLGISYSFNSSTQDIIKGDIGTNELEDVTTNRVDIGHFSVEPTGGNYGISSYYEERDSTFSLVRSYGLNTGYGRNITRFSKADLFASFSISEYPDTDDKTDILSLTANWRYFPTSNIYMDFNSRYWEMGGTTLDEKGYSFKMSLALKLRLLKLSMSLLHQQVNESTQDRENSSIFFKAFRRF